MRTSLSLARLAVALGLMAAPASAEALPDGFVRLGEIAPQIEQDMRYHGSHNFVGRPIAGYEAPECILTEQAAQALLAVADDLAREGLGLKVYDCYRPASAVADFVAWAEDIAERRMQAEFYPRVDKRTLFSAGYIAHRSGHSRGSTVDLAVRPLDAAAAEPWTGAEPLVDCTRPEAERYADGILDFGTGFDCFDARAHHGAEGLDAVATQNRAMLMAAMMAQGFKPYAQEWWHYTLASEPFPDTYFDFPVTAAAAGQD